MSGILGLIYRDINKLNSVLKLVETIDALSLCERNVWSLENGVMANAWIQDKKGSLLNNFENDRLVVCIYGEPIDTEKLTLENLELCISKSNYNLISEMKGCFTIGIFDKKYKTIYLISDKTSQQPIYFYHDEDGFVFSTELSTFCRLDRSLKFNINWLYEMIFFNYPIGSTTFIQNVKRMPPACVLIYSYESNKTLLKRYSEPFKRRKTLIKGKEALEHSYYVFKKRVPKYFKNTEKVVIPLTGGFDSRTVLSILNQYIAENMETYTYGIQNCYDLIEASYLTKNINIKNNEIILNQEFLQKLPQLIYDTVLLSGGLEKICRSTLTYVYKILTDNGKNRKRIISGVSGDHLFRDHINGSGNVPALISFDMMKLFQKGEFCIDKIFFKKVFGDKYKDFENHIREVIVDLNYRYGDLTKPESYLSFLVYETGPKYFAGESAIANQYATFVSPYWDSEIINLSYEVEYSTLGFSEKLKNKDKYRECLMQAYIIERNNKLKRVAIKGGLPIKAFTSDNKLVYNLYRFLRRGPKKVMSIIKKEPKILMENWELWLNNIIDNEIKRLLSSSSLVNEYIDTGFIFKLQENQKIHWINKIATAEIIMKLINSKWNL